MCAVMRKATHHVLADARIAAGQRGLKPKQTFRIEGRQEIIRGRRIDVARPKIILNETIWTIERRRVARGERIRLIGQTGKRGKSKERVDRLDHGIVVPLGMGDGMHARIG